MRAFLIILTIILSHFPQTRYISVILSSDGKLRVPADEVIDDFDLKPNMAALLGRDRNPESETRETHSENEG